MYFIPHRRCEHTAPSIAVNNVGRVVSDRQGFRRLQSAAPNAPKNRSEAKCLIWQVLARFSLVQSWHVHVAKSVSGLRLFPGIDSFMLRP